MFSSPALSKDLNLPFPSSPFKEEADLLHLDHPHQIGSGLLRYRSARSTVHGEVCGDLPEADTVFARFMAPPPHPREKQTCPDVSPQPQMMLQLHHLQQQQHVPSLSSMSMGQEHAKNSVGSGLIRQSSSPAGLFSHLNVENGFLGMKGVGDFLTGGTAAEAAISKGQMSFPLRQRSLLSQISEIGDEEEMDDDSPEEGGGGGRCYIPGFPVTSWEGGAVLPENFSGGKRFREPLEAQNGDMRNQNSNLAHHFSLSKSITDAMTMERFMQFQDTVPCKVRAKRGCATHPRSIAERVRRTRISERMRKLQELVPNMDKQTNTADMLDLAVEYIKDLQSQAKVLSESHSSCTCPSKQKP